jgi:hypothetical protein
MERLFWVGLGLYFAAGFIGAAYMLITRGHL